MDPEQRDQEREYISDIFTITTLTLFKGRSRLNKIKFLTELTLYICGYDFILIINREKSRSLTLLIGCVVIPSTIHLVYMTFAWTYFSKHKNHFRDQTV